MRTRFWLALPIAALAACNIDFVAVEGDSGSGDEGASAVLHVDNRNGLVAILQVVLPGTSEPPVVFVGGAALQGVARDDGRWAIDTVVAVETLDPRLELEIRTDEVVVVPFVFFARDGPATRRENGDLEVPLVYGGDRPDSNLWWQVHLLDSNERPLLTVHSLTAELPDPLVISGALVPPTAVAALVESVRSERIAGAPYVIHAHSQSTIRVPIEGE